MLDEIDDILYQWKQNFITREAAEDRIIDLAVAFNAERQQRQERAASTDPAELTPLWTK